MRRSWLTIDRAGSQVLKKRLTRRGQLLFQAPGAITVSASPGLRTILIAAAAAIMSVLHPRQFEVVFPVGAFFLQRSRTVANLYPARSSVRAEPCLRHIAQVFAFRHGTVAQSFVFNCLQQSPLATRLHSRSHQIAHASILYRRSEIERRAASVWLPLAGFARRHSLIEPGRLAAGNAERFPSRMLKVLGQKHNLPDMVCVVRKLTVERLHHRMGLASD